MNWIFVFLKRTFPVLLLALALPSLLAADVYVQSRVYKVGPGQAYLNLSNIAWYSLQPGDRVEIYPRLNASGQIIPYKEKILLATSGNSQLPILVTGMPGPTGEFPILDGQDATTDTQFQFLYGGIEKRGLFTVSTDKRHAYGYKPQHIVIQNLELRNAHPKYSFTDSTGTLTDYNENVAALYVERGENITIKNCRITGSGNGVFVQSAKSTDPAQPDAAVSRDILLEGNLILENGVSGSNLYHNVYTEASNMTFRFNHIGKATEGAEGASLKDRSAGTIIEYNFIECVSRCLDLVDPNSSSGILNLEAAYSNTFVYGNVFQNSPPAASVLFNFGGDTGNTAQYRQTLNFYHNTVVSESNKSDNWRITFFNFSTDAQKGNLQNNIFYIYPDNPGAERSIFCLTKGTGKFTLNKNWFNKTWFPAREDGTGKTPGFNITGSGNILTNSKDDAGFMNLSNGDYHLKARSQNLNKARDLPGEFPPVLMQYTDLAGISRNQVGTAMDLGAFEDRA